MKYPYLSPFLAKYSFVRIIDFPIFRNEEIPESSTIELCGKGRNINRDLKRKKLELISHRHTQTHTDLGLNRLRPDEISFSILKLR
jgi:hypothetical protein